MYVISNKVRFFEGNPRFSKDPYSRASPTNAKRSEVKARHSRHGCEGELTRFCSPLVSGKNSRYSSCTVYYNMAQASGETTGRASNRYLLKSPGALWQVWQTLPFSHGYASMQA